MHLLRKYHEKVCSQLGKVTLNLNCTAWGGPSQNVRTKSVNEGFPAINSVRHLFGHLSILAQQNLRFMRRWHFGGVGNMTQTGVCCEGDPTEQSPISGQC